MSKIIAIQGDRGSFDEIAAKKYFKNDDVELLYCQTMLDVFQAVDKNKADSALVVIGNNHYGDINHVYEVIISNRLFSSGSKLWISGEVYLNVNHCLLATPGATIEEIREIHSQPPTIIQCFSFIHNNLGHAAVVEEDDTALSARLVSEWKDKSIAAIASKEAAKIYGLQVLANNIQDDVNNICRYIVIDSKEIKPKAKINKSSILIKTNQENGALYNIFKLFYEHNLNVSYLQSIPIPNRQFEYRFYLDIDSSILDSKVDFVLTSLREMGYQYDVLGSYKKAKIPKLTY